MRRIENLDLSPEQQKIFVKHSVGNVMANVVDVFEKVNLTQKQWAKVVMLLGIYKGDAKEELMYPWFYGQL